MIELTQARLKELLSYDPVTGLFTWCVATAQRTKVGSIAGTANDEGYRHIQIDGRKYSEHYLVFLWMTGAWPKKLVDHRDCNPGNNIWLNLREATPSQQCANRRAFNKLGVKGVYPLPSGKYQAAIQVNGKQKYLGSFDTITEAHTAYVKAANDNYGEFARAS
jgi:hypothetical protein